MFDVMSVSDSPMDPMNMFEMYGVFGGGLRLSCLWIQLKS